MEEQRRPGPGPGHGPRQSELNDAGMMLLHEMHHLNVNLQGFNDNMETITQMLMVIIGNQAQRAGVPLEDWIRQGLDGLFTKLGEMLGVPRQHGR